MCNLCPTLLLSLSLYTSNNFLGLKKAEPSRFIYLFPTYLITGFDGHEWTVLIRIIYDWAKEKRNQTRDVSVKVTLWKWIKPVWLSFAHQHLGILWFFLLLSYLFSHLLMLCPVSELNLTFSKAEAWSRCCRHGTWIFPSPINTHCLVPAWRGQCAQCPRGVGVGDGRMEKLNFSDPQISCCIVLKTDQNQCTSFMTPNKPQCHPICGEAWKLFCATYCCLTR